MTATNIDDGNNSKNSGIEMNLISQNSGSNLNSQKDSHLKNFISELEVSGIEVISEDKRYGKASMLFWPWAAGNISLLALSFGSIFLGYGISIWQSAFAAIIGVVASFLLVGISSLAGKRTNAPTMAISRAIFGVRGNVFPSLLSWAVFVGWETILVSLASLATATVLSHFKVFSANEAKIFGFVISLSITLIGGVWGYKIIIKLQKWITTTTLILSVVYIALTINKIDIHKLSELPHGSAAAFFGAMIVGITSIGLGWVNTAADYSRYLPKDTKSRSVVAWTVFGASIVPIIFVIYGSLLAGSQSGLKDAISVDPIGALTTILPTWFLIPFAVLAILGLIGGAILDLYSSSLTLVSIGLPLKRPSAALVDGTVMIVGSIYLVWISNSFIGALSGFLVIIGVPVAGWSAMFVADVIFRKKDYDLPSLYNKKGIYGSINWISISILLFATFIGFGFVTPTSLSWFSWQGYFLNYIGGKTGVWGNANVGVIFALLLGFILYAPYAFYRNKKQAIIIKD